MEEKVKRYISEQKLFQDTGVVVIGVSGGADSICLLRMLLQQRADYGIEIIVVHVNHQLRGEEAVRDAVFVKNICEELDVKCHIYEFDVAKIAQEEKLSVEEAGRIVRKRALEEVAGNYEKVRIATAHHMNDNAETFLMNVARGTGITGLGAIRAKKGRWIRPLLCVERKEIEGFIKERKLEYCEDSSNKENIYTRNNVRNRVIPILEKEVNSHVIKHIDQVIKEVDEVEEYLQEIVETHWDESVKTARNGIEIDCEDLKAMKSVIQKKLVKRAIGFVANSEKNISRVHVEQVIKLLEKQSGKWIELPYGVIAEREFEKLKLYRRTEYTQHGKEWSLEVPDCIELINGDKISIEVIGKVEGKWEIEETPYTKYYDYDIMKGNLTLRNRMSGDEITIDKKGSKQKLKKYFINAKIPKKEREEALVVSIGNKILWIIGYRRSQDYLVSDETKQILKIQLEKR